MLSMLLLHAALASDPEPAPSIELDPHLVGRGGIGGAAWSLGAGLTAGSFAAFGSGSVSAGTMLGLGGLAGLSMGELLAAGAARTQAAQLQSSGLKVERWPLRVATPVHLAAFATTATLFVLAAENEGQARAWGASSVALGASLPVWAWVQAGANRRAIRRRP